MRTIPISRVTVEPTAEPITVEQVKLNAYVVSDTSWDDLIRDQLIPASRRMVEQLAQRSLITQTRKQYYDDLPYEMHIRYSPVQSISSITYKDTAGATQTLSSALYTVDTASIPGRVVQAWDQTYPSTLCDTNAVQVTAVCGYGASSSSVPIIYRRAMILICTTWFNNRGICPLDGDTYRALESMLSIEGATIEYA